MNKWEDQNQTNWEQNVWTNTTNYDQIYSTDTSETVDLSGKKWINRFKGSTSVLDLAVDFRKKVQNFIEALMNANAKIVINATFRPPERAYLMHWSWKIVKKDFDPQKIPLNDKVNIEWWHGNLNNSIKGAQEMVTGFQIGHLKTAPALNSRHTEGNAIDMEITWQKTLKILDVNNKENLIETTPQNHTNKQLIDVAKTFGVYHFIPIANDKVHWSTDGR